MLVTLCNIGHSKGVIIPKPILTELHFEKELELVIENDALVLRKPKSKVRVGWAAASKKLAKQKGNKLVLPEFDNEWDAEWKW